MSNLVCHDMAPLLSAMIDGELEAGEKNSVDQHLGQCATCQERFQRLKGVVTLLRDQAPVPEESHGFVARLDRRLAAEAPLAISDAPFSGDPLDQELPESESGRLALAALAGSRQWGRGFLRGALAAGLLFGIALGVRQVESGFGDLRVAWNEFGNAERKPTAVARGGSSGARHAEAPGLPLAAPPQTPPLADPGTAPLPHETGALGPESSEPPLEPAVGTFGEPLAGRPEPGLVPSAGPAVESGLGGQPSPPAGSPADPAARDPGAAQLRIDESPVPAPVDQPRVVPENGVRVKHESLLACAQLIQTVRSKQTPPKVREAAIHGLGAYDLPLAHGLLRDVLAGGLDHLGEVRRARSAAFTALGLMTSEAAADLLIEAGLRRQRGAIQNGSDSWRVAARRALGHACLQSDDLSRSLAAKYLVVPNQAGKLTAHRVEVALLVTEAFGQAGPGLAREAVAAVAESLAHLSAVPSAAVSESGLAAALAKTLGQAGAVRHGRLLVNLVDSDLSSRHWTVREAAVEALGVMGSADLWSEHGQAEGQGGGGTTDALGQDSYVACLAVAMRRDPDQRVREMAALALARIPVAGSVEALVASLPSQSPMGAEQQALYGCQSTALFLLTGRVPGHPRGWVDLVDQFGATGLLEPLLSSGPPSQAEWEGAETLFGLPAQSSSVLFLVDISDSMRHEGKIALAKRQLVRMIETLGSQTRFSVWAFSDGVQRLLPTPRPATRLLQDRMISRVDLLRARQGARTGLEKVLQLALEPGHVDVVVLLTDGLLESQSSIGSAALIDRVGKYNTKRRSILHVVGVFRGEAALHLDRGGDRGDPASDLLRGLARENKGLLLRN